MQAKSMNTDGGECQIHYFRPYATRRAKPLGCVLDKTYEINKNKLHHINQYRFPSARTARKNVGFLPLRSKKLQET